MTKDFPSINKYFDYNTLDYEFKHSDIFSDINSLRLYLENCYYNKDFKNDEIKLIFVSPKTEKLIFIELFKVNENEGYNIFINDDLVFENELEIYNILSIIDKRLEKEVI